MKTAMKTIALVLAVALLSVSFVACSDTASTSVKGNTYDFASYVVDGEDVTETMTMMFSKQSLTFKEDGVCVQTLAWADAYAELMGSSDPIEQNGTWEEKDGTVTATFASDEGDTVFVFTVDGETLTMTEDGSVTTYNLQKNS